MGKDSHFTGQPVYSQVLKLLDREKITKISRETAGSEANVQRLTGRTRMVGDTILQVQLDPLSIATLEVPIQIKHSGDLLTADATYLLVPQSNFLNLLDNR